MNKPYIAVQIKEDVYIQMKALHERASKPISDEDKALGADLLAQTYVQLLDTCFTHLLDELNKTQPDKMLQDASKVIHKVQSEAQHYIGWLIKFIANKRGSHFEPDWPRISLHRDSGHYNIRRKSERCNECLGSA